MIRPSAYPSDLFGALQEGFDHIYRSSSHYRQTGVVLAGLLADANVQYTLFDDTARIERMSRIYSTLDMLSERFGKYTVHHAASLPTRLQTQHEGERGDIPKRVVDLLKGENKRQRVRSPMLHIKV